MRRFEGDGQGDDRGSAAAAVADESFTAPGGVGEAGDGQLQRLTYAVCKAMYQRGVTQKLMQTYAWSRGQVFPQNSIYQYENDISVNGIGIDRCESNGDAGGWRVGMAVKPTAPQLSKEVAANIIDSFLKKHWTECEAERVKAE